MDGKPMLKKTRFLMDCVRSNCHCHFHPGPDLALDKITRQMSGCSHLKKKLRFKPIGEGIQFFAIAESNNGSQYLYTFELDRNNKEDEKVKRSILCLITKLPPGSKHHQIAADNLFNSVATCRKVAEKGHCIYGTMLLDRGVPDHLIDASKNLKQQGEWCFVMSPQDCTRTIW
jgi:hypothetical protein